MNRLPFYRRLAIGALFLGVPAVASARQQHPGLDAPGFQQNRDYFSEMPFENIDTLSGSLVLTFTDLVLPGNAGRELRFQRTYNSKTGAWTFGLAGVPLRISNPPYPTAETPGIQELTPALLMSDGGKRIMAWYVSPNINVPSTFDEAISSNFWRFNRAGTTRKLSIPNGDTCDYENEAEPTMLRVTICRDLFNNEITFQWLPTATPPQLLITQELSSTVSRVVTLEFEGPDPRFPSSMEYESRTWTYGYTGINLSTVTPPEGPGWAFTYDGLKLLTLTTPHGGVIEYAYENKSYEGPESPQVQYSTLVVIDRETSGQGIEPGTWHYEYAIGLNGVSGQTTVQTPSARIVYEHGWNESPLAVFDAEGGIVPLIRRTVQTEDGSTDLEIEERTYTLLTVLSWWTFGTLELQTRTITRHDGGTPTEFETTFEYDEANFGDYHQPELITETGTAGTRSTNRTFQHSATPYLVGLPLTEAVTVGSQTFNKSWTYDSQTGFKTSETTFGIETEFAADGFGNVQTITKANNKTTQFQYQHGQVRTIWTPEYPITRTVNPDGSIASQTVAGRTTTFTYDDLGRL